MTRKGNFFNDAKEKIFVSKFCINIYINPISHNHGTKAGWRKLFEDVSHCIPSEIIDIKFVIF